MSTSRTGTQPTTRDRTRRIVTLVPLIALLALAMAGGTAAAQETATPIATPVPADACELVAPGVGSEAWVRTELYFGTTRPDGTDVTPGEWQAFLDEEITPRFPDGLTILEGYGQFLDEEGVIIAQESVVLIIFYPANEVETASAGFEEIRDAYEEQFDQESVLRVDSEPVCVSF